MASLGTGGKSWSWLCILVCTLQPGWVQPLVEAKYIIHPWGEVRRFAFAFRSIRPQVPSTTSLSPWGQKRDISCPPIPPPGAGGTRLTTGPPGFAPSGHGTPSPSLSAIAPLAILARPPNPSSLARWPLSAAPSPWPGGPSQRPLLLAWATGGGRPLGWLGVPPLYFYWGGLPGRLPSGF